MYYETTKKNSKFFLTKDEQKIIPRDENLLIIHR